ncbi:serine acetyltransferase [Clostridium perfringens]|nr:serine acetyltransferase [Clostridium perfringens]
MIGKDIFTILNMPRFVILNIYFFNTKYKDIYLRDMKGLMYHYKGKKSGVYAFNYLLANVKSFRNVAYFRIKNKIIRKMAYLLCGVMKDLELGGEIGSGLTIYHGFASVIEPKKIGENCSIYQNVTIGRRQIKGRDFDKPIIGNNVNIYAGAIVVGGIYIGDNVNIGAGSVVLTDIPNNCTVVGNPSRIIKKNIELT